MTSVTLPSPVVEASEATPPCAIVAEDLVKIYGHRRVVDGISFTVNQGEILGLLGPNGAGKTTTMRLLAGYTPANSGRASIAGFDVSRNSMEARRRLGYLPESAPLYEDMKVAEYLNFMAEVKQCPGHLRRKWVNQAVEECGLTELTRGIIGTLSKGQRQRVGLAQAVLGEPAVLILDEPTVGLDPRQIVEIRQMIKNMAGRRTVLLSTHILPEVNIVCQKVVVLNEGKLVASGTPDHLVSKFQRDLTLCITLEGDITRAREILDKIPGVGRMRHEHQSDDDEIELMIQVKPGFDPRAEISHALIQNGFSLVEIALHGASLEDVFLRAISTMESHADSDGSDSSSAEGGEARVD